MFDVGSSFDYIQTMTTVTIPRGLAEQKDLVAVPRSTYEEFLAWQKKVKPIKTFKPTAGERRALARAKRNFAKGNYLTLEEVKHELESNY